MIRTHGPLKPGELAFIIDSIAKMKRGLVNATDDIAETIRIAKKVQTNNRAPKVEEFVGTLSHLGGRLDGNLVWRLTRSQRVFKSCAQAIRYSDKISIGNFMRENFVSSPESVTIDIVEGTGDSDIPQGDSLSRWKDINCSLDDIELGEFSLRELTWSWIGSENIN